LLGSGLHATMEVLLEAVFSMGLLRGYVIWPTDLILTEKSPLLYILHKGR
jgi:hypothetical protein